MSSVLAMDPNPTEKLRKRTLSQKVEVGITSLIVVLVALVGGVSFLYLAHANRNATKGYALKNLELRRTQLMVENEVWDMQIARVKALDNIQNDPSIRTMVRADKPKFVRGDTAIASTK